ncbi:MAG TPA: VWA domain-containing protein [Candidatus Acidoferrum sp.]|nr:VWA domain-containing protein [Candidatus Acidoferrum sp.]
MGLLEYAWAVSFQKDYLKARIQLDSTICQPTLTWDESRLSIRLPAPQTSEEGNLLFMGYQFQPDFAGKVKIGRLFRTCISHLTAHTLMPIDDGKRTATSSKSTNVENFARSLAVDVYVNAYIKKHAPDRFPDLALANSFVLARMKSVEKIFNPATRIMAALMSKINMGIVKGKLQPEEQNSVDKLISRLLSLEEKIQPSFAGEEVKLDDVLEETINSVIETLESNGPVLEAPSLLYAEKIGACSLFHLNGLLSGEENEDTFRKCLEALTGTASSNEPMDSYWKKESDMEITQAFDTESQQKTREKKMLDKLQEYVQETKLKSIGFPEEDYTQYLQARSILPGGSRRLLDSLRVAQDALDEDGGKEFGQLDLTAIIQVLASRKPATDVFLRDEYLSRSYAWGILLDASASMRVRSEFARSLAICIAEAAKELLMDPGSWSFFAFSDRFYVLKDPSEAYSQRVRARIGGLKFDGLTYMPDAIQVAGKILTKRYDEQRFLVVISDGTPFGYPDVEKAMKETIGSLEKKGVIMIGAGVETDKMKDFFKISSIIHNQKDLIKSFAKIYVSSSEAALET